jgi:CRISPR-associated protein Csm2
VSEVNQDNYLTAPNGYLDEKGAFRKEIYVEEALFVQKKLKESFRDANGKSGKTETHQLRKFYNQVKSFEINIQEGQYEQKRNELYALLPKANYAYQRGLVHPFFVDFLRKNIDWAVQDERQFKGFVQHFESIVGYYKEER